VNTGTASPLVNNDVIHIMIKTIMHHSAALRHHNG